MKPAPPKPRPLATDLRAASQLLVEATTKTTQAVEAVHHRIAGGPLAWPVRAVSGLVYSSIVGVTRAVGAAIDKTLEQLSPVLGEGPPGPERLAVMAALNGVIGDVLAQRGSPLAQPMELRRHSTSPPSPKLLVLVHGSAMSELQWLRQGHDHGAALERDTGCSAVYVAYNSGLHVSENGRQLAALLEELVASWPVQVEALALLGFSMGGLVARSACHVAELEGLRWRRRLRTLVCLGTPHHGSPVERVGSWVDALLGATPYSAPLARLAKVRSAGVTDLRFGNVLDEHWQGKDRFALSRDTRAPVPLPRGVRCFAIAATRSTGPGKRLRTDGLVPVTSALGHAKGALELAFPKDRQRVIYGTSHQDLLCSTDAYAALREWVF